MPSNITRNNDLARAAGVPFSRPFANPVSSSWFRLPPESRASIGTLTPVISEKELLAMGPKDDLQEASETSFTDRPVPLTVRDSLTLEADRTKDEILEDKSENLKILCDIQDSITGFFDILNSAAIAANEKWNIDLYQQAGGPLKIARSWKFSALNKQFQADPDFQPETERAIEDLL